ncbi:MAG: hypothetical protein MN733_38985 [Nitrososphaera sp.]|nr:hypothetical protein [Nitrososphaera sp.]
MKTWDVAKALIGVCQSAEDVDELNEMLDSAATRRELRKLLSGFAMERRSGDRQPINRAENVDLSNISNLEVIDRLRKLSRNLGLTNAAVESWIRRRFNLDSGLRKKESLESYLTRIFRTKESNFPKRVLATALDELVYSSQSQSELRTYWDEFDKLREVSR